MTYLERRSTRDYTLVYFTLLHFSSTFNVGRRCGIPRVVELLKKVKKTFKVIGEPLAILHEERLGKLEKERQ